MARKLSAAIFSLLISAAAFGQGGPFGDKSDYPFPVTAGNEVACYDQALEEQEKVDRYEDYRAVEPGECENRWAAIPGKRRG